MITVIVKNKNLTGFLAIDNDGKDCVCKGGIRMTPNVNREEIERLAKVMTHKCKYYKLPYCGAKAGIVFDGKNKKQKIREFFGILRELNLF